MLYTYRCVLSFLLITVVRTKLQNASKSVKCSIFFPSSTDVREIYTDNGVILYNLINLKGTIEVYINLLITSFGISHLAKLICNKSCFLFIFIFICFYPLHSFPTRRVDDFHLLGRSLFPDITVHLVFDGRSDGRKATRQRSFIRNNNNLRG